MVLHRNHRHLFLGGAVATHVLAHHQRVVGHEEPAGSHLEIDIARERIDLANGRGRDLPAHRVGADDQHRLAQPGPQVCIGGAQRGAAGTAPGLDPYARARIEPEGVLHDLAHRDLAREDLALVGDDRVLDRIGIAPGILQCIASRFHDPVDRGAVRARARELREPASENDDIACGPAHRLFRKLPCT